MSNEHLKGPFFSEAALSSDLQHIRYIEADLGEGKPMGIIASVRNRPELTQDENLLTAQLFMMAPELRDQLCEMLGFVEAWQAHLSDSGKAGAAKTVADALDRAREVLKVTETINAKSAKARALLGFDD